MKMRGQSLVELILIMGLMALILPALLIGFVASQQGKPQMEKRMQAVALLKETEEALKSVRNTDWTTFATFSGTLHPVINGTRWSLASGTQTTDGLTQQIVLNDVYRDSSGNIAASGTLDPSTRKADITISWTQPYVSSVTSTIYVSRINSLTSLDTTLTDFNTGTTSGTVVVATGGSSTDGEVQLSTGGHGNWCSPSLALNTLDLPGSGYASSVKAIEGNVFVGTGENSSGLTYMGVTITNADPPVASFESTFDGYKTNDVFGETGYSYVATDTNAKEVVIINTASVPYTEAGYFNAPGNGTAESIYVNNNIGYATVGNRLYNFDLSSKSGSRPILDSNGVTLAGTGEKVIVLGNYAYVVLSGASVELQIVDISNTSNLSVVGQADVDGQAAYDLFVNSSATRAYLATGISATQREMFIIDISTKTGSRSTIGSYEANGMDPNGITVVPGNIAVLVGTGAEEYQVINIANESTPARCGGAQVNAGVNGIASVLESDGDAYSYIVTGDAASEFKIIQGGAGGSFSTSGTFESAVFDATSSAAFNRLVATVNQPSQTTLRLQVGVASPVSGSCTGAAYSYLGPDRTSNTYFTPNAASISAQIPFGTVGQYSNPQRCFRYKAWFDTSDITQSPTLYDVRWNYSL